MGIALTGTKRLTSTLAKGWPIVLLGGTMWLARYLHSGQFGLYEDDLTFVPAAAQRSFPEMVENTFSRIALAQGQGRPLHHVLIDLLSHASWRLGELRGAYLLGFLLITLNVVLFFGLVRRVHSTALGVIAAIFYALYSADTTQAFLTHSFGLQPALTMLLLALYAYLDERRLAAYGFLSLALLSYETTFPVFLAAPLLGGGWDRRMAGRLVRNGWVMGLILALSLAIRVGLGEPRVAGLGLREMLVTPLSHILEGPPVALATYVYRPLQALEALDLEIALALSVAAVVFAAVLLTMSLGTPSALAAYLRSVRQAIRDRGFSVRKVGAVSAGLPAEVKALARLAAAGLTMLVLAYPLTLTVRAYAISGRDTRVHAAGVIGAALCLGSLTMGALWMAEAVGRKRWAAAIAGLWLGLMAAYGIVLQRDYARAWTLQQDFWTPLVRLIPDVRDGTVILVDPAGLQDSRQIGANTWNLPRVLRQIYTFPSEWASVPRVYRMVPGWEETLLTDDGGIVLDAGTISSPSFTSGVIDPAETILIVMREGRLQRVSGSYLVDDVVVDFQTTTAVGEPAYPPGFLYEYLVLESRREG